MKRALVLAQQLVEEGRLAEAEEVCRAQLRTRTHSAHSIFHMLALLCCQTGRFEEAVQFASSAVKLEPRMPEYFAAQALGLHRLGRLREAADAYQMVFLLDSEFEDACTNYGWLLLENGEVTLALVTFERALRIAPHNATARDSLLQALRLAVPAIDWETLGDDQRHEGALTYLNAAAVEDPALNGDAALIADVGFALVRRWRVAEGLALLERATALDPDSAVVWLTRAGALSRLHQHAASEEAIRRTTDLCRGRTDPRHGRLAAQAHLLRAVNLLRDGRWQEGWAEYEWRLPYLRSLRRERKPAWDGERLDGETVLVYAEQGMGDSIQFARFLPQIAERGGRVILQCHPCLVRLMHTVQGVCEVIPSTSEPYPGRPSRRSRPRYDMRAALMSLPYILRTTGETLPTRVPYLHPAAEEVRQWGARLGTSPVAHIGLVWAGNPAMRDNDDRSCGLHELEPLRRLQGIAWYSLQKDRLGNSVFEMVDWTSELRDFQDTAALVANLDAVVTVDTAVAHLAGALGKPTFTLVRYSADWRWKHGDETTPWYPTMQLFHQPQPRDWRTPVVKLSSALAAWLQGRQTPTSRS